MKSLKKAFSANSDVPAPAINRFPSMHISKTKNTAITVRGSATDPSQPSVEMSWTGSGSPPTYTRATTPTTPITYAFVVNPKRPLRRLLIPVVASPDSRPLFALVLQSDPWTAWSSHLTLTRLNSDGTKTVVGTLGGAGGMSFTHVSMGQQVRPVGEVVLPNQSTRWEEDQYLWQFKSNTRPLELLWVVKDGMLTCLPNTWVRNLKPSLATTEPLAKLGGPERKENEITLWPSVYQTELLDHIILSTIVLRHILLAPRSAPPPEDSSDSDSLWDTMTDLVTG